MNKFYDIKNDGAENLIVISDFDFTLTQAKYDEHGDGINTISEQLRTHGNLINDYTIRVNAMHNYYSKIENDQNLDIDLRRSEMKAWLESRLRVLIAGGFNHKIIDDVLGLNNIKLRSMFSPFFRYLRNKKIPVFILSAAPGEMIETILRNNDVLFNNTKIIANFFTKDSSNNFISSREPIIHSLNKKMETIINVYPHLLGKNVILLGDKLDDLDMAEGIDAKNILKIGFYNHPTDDKLACYQKAFDIVLAGKNQSLIEVNKLIREIN